MLAAAAPRAAADGPCFTIKMVGGSDVCSGAFDCVCPGGDFVVAGGPLGGATIKVAFGTSGSSGPGPAAGNCCRTITSIPPYHELSGGNKEVQNIGATTGLKFVASCELDCSSFLGFRWGTATCSYDSYTFGTFPLYAYVGACPGEEEQ
jgi:hypothetical protein